MKHWHGSTTLVLILSNSPQLEISVAEGLPGRDKMHAEIYAIISAFT